MEADGKKITLEDFKVYIWDIILKGKMKIFLIIKMNNINILLSFDEK
jgi:hypothetical protein